MFSAGLRSIMIVWSVVWMVVVLLIAVSYIFYKVLDYDNVA